MSCADHVQLCLAAERGAAEADSPRPAPGTGTTSDGRTLEYLLGPSVLPGGCRGLVPHAPNSSLCGCSSVLGDDVAR